MSPENSAIDILSLYVLMSPKQTKLKVNRSHFFSVGKVLKQINKNLSLKVARTNLYTRWSYFGVAFFGRKDLTDFYDFWHLLWVQKRLR